MLNFPHKICHILKIILPSLYIPYVLATSPISIIPIFSNFTYLLRYVSHLVPVVNIIIPWPVDDPSVHPI